MPASKVLRGVAEGDAELVSVVKLALGNDSFAEMTAEQNAREKGKDREHESGEHVERETVISFQAEATVKNADKIAVKFSFKQIASESASSASSDAEEEDSTETFEVSSTLVLVTGQPRVVGAKQAGDEATLLILRADI
ncbi:MAG: hypothetical protein CEE38_08700 [Planctomycetes bacterium B3_Pla]|nr:MAG: hypothetical protein CEE38_08700 [Planctomycetes bacterium B3_Pla]